VVGSSPEALVKLTGRAAEMRPIAGTRPRGADDSRDAALEAELRADPKENAEHVMLVDLARNDLGRVVAAGSVRVDPYRSIERYSHVMHIKRCLRRRVPAGTPPGPLRPAFPANALVRRRRCARCRSSTNSNRCAVASPARSAFGHGGDMNQAITIRTMVSK
jgi:anthranilate synthase component 1